MRYQLAPILPWHSMVRRCGSSRPLQDHYGGPEIDAITEQLEALDFERASLCGQQPKREG
jgi:hypothetical protein